MTLPRSFPLFIQLGFVQDFQRLFQQCLAILLRQLQTDAPSAFRLHRLQNARGEGQLRVVKCGDQLIAHLLVLTVAGFAVQHFRVVSLIICSVMTFVASRDRGWFLLPIVYSFAMINLAFASFMPGEFITHLEASPELMVHIGLALFSYATLIIAALYALQLAWLDYLLKNKKLTFSADMPPLMSIERKMFHITQIGVVLLTLTLCTGLLYMDNLFSKENVHKAVLSIMAWFVYIVLLWGHYHEGWRGRRVVWFSFAGAFLLTLAYFGSRLIQQVMVR